MVSRRGAVRIGGKALAGERALSIADLDIQPFRRTQGARGFSCGITDLNDFLNTDQVEKYEAEGLGKTYLVYHDDELVAYFTVRLAELRVEYLRTWNSFSRMAEMNLEAVPALKIGRLAVDLKFQGRGVGAALVNYIAGMALETMRTMGVRLLILQAKPESVAFYKRCGFHFTVETKRERSRVNRTMFLDLQAIEHVG